MSKGQSPATPLGAAALLRAALAALLLALAPGVALANYTLRPGDVVSLTVFGLVDFSHSSQVDLDGAVSLPIVGRLQVAGLTLDAVRQAIFNVSTSGALRQTNSLGDEVVVYPELADIIVDVVSYAPVYVSGDVAVGGEFAFRPGLTIRQLLAQAGGLRTPDPRDVAVLDARSSLAAERLLAERQLETATAQVRRIEAQLEALSAGPSPESGPEPEAAAEAPEGAAVELTAGGPGTLTEAPMRPRPRPAMLAGADLAATDPVPEAAPDPAPEGSEEPDLAERAAATATDAPLDPVGQRILASDRSARSEERALTEGVIDQLRDNLAIFEARLAEEEELADISRERVERLTELASRGLVPEAERLESLRALRTSNAQLLDTQAEIVDLRIDIARLLADLDRADAQDVQTLLEQLEARSIEAELARAQLDALDARTAMLEGLIRAGGLEPSFVLHRGDGAAASARQVGPDEPLEPGDVVEVILPPPVATPAP